MKAQNRRTFLKTSGMSGLGLASVSSLGKQWFINNDKKKPYINFTRDGLDFTPGDYINELSRIEKARGIRQDSYSNGGIVAEMEEKIASILGMEAAVFMPTGTLANQIAIRKLAWEKTRVIVQAESHIYNDSGDCAQVLSGLNIIPAAVGSAEFSLKEVMNEVERSDTGRVTTGIGAISIESPVRRNNNQVFPYESMKGISEYARKKEIGMHLDGARLFNASVHENIPLTDYARLFDTVYISLYKDFNAASGAVLVGTKEFCENLFHTRRMFGGGMPNAWPYAAVAMEYMDSFISEYKQALRTGDELFLTLEKSGRFRREKINGGTNVMKLHVLEGSPAQVRDTLLAENIKLPTPAKDFKGFYIKINPSINRIDSGILARKFLE